MKRVFIASDHNGNAARAYIIRTCSGIIDIVDLGPKESDGKVDYPDKARSLCTSVLGTQDSFGILICGTGTGMSIAANRFKGIRAAIVTDKATAILAREHNDANVLVLGQWRTSLDQMELIVRSFLTTSFGEGRHLERVKKLEEL